MSNTADSNETGGIRHPPQQGRARATLERIEDATKQVLRDPTIGRDRFTTAQVAEVAGLSIGSIYRYFVDRHTLLEHVWPDRRDSVLPPEQPSHGALRRHPNDE